MSVIPCRRGPACDATVNATAAVAAARDVVAAMSEGGTISGASCAAPASVVVTDGMSDDGIDTGGTARHVLAMEGRSTGGESRDPA